MRCPNCNKFVPYDEPVVEINSTDIHESIATVEVRVVLKCADCGEELKDSDMTAEKEIEHDCENAKKGEKPTFEWKDEPADGEGTERTQTTDRHGKPIKLSRYMKRFYGFTSSGSVECQKCKEIIELDFESEEQASGFNELV